VWPDYRTLANPETAFMDVAQVVGGYRLFAAFGVVLLVSSLACGLAGHLGAVRLLYGMGRDNLLPRKFFGYLDPKNHIPRNNVIFVGAIALVGAFLISYDQGAELLNFGALLAFMGVNAAAFVRYFLRADKKHWFDFISPVLGFVICLFIWRNLSSKAMLLGAVWMGVGIAYGAVKTKGFQAELVKFDIPPDES
jgi:amino acid transporter